MSTQPYMNTVVAPGAGGTVVQTAALPPGDYQLVVLPSYGAVADLRDNMQVILPAGAVPAGPLPLMLPPVISGNPVEQRFDISLPLGGTVRVTAVAAGAVGSVYVCALRVTPGVR